jgi:hypothetical protein
VELGLKPGFIIYLYAIYKYSEASNSMRIQLERVSNFIAYISIVLIVVGIFVFYEGLSTLGEVSAGVEYVYTNITIPAYFFNITNPGNYSRVDYYTLVNVTSINKETNYTANVTTMEGCKLQNRVNIALVATAPTGTTPEVDLEVYGCYSEGNCTQIFNTTMPAPTKKTTGNITCSAETSNEYTVLSCRGFFTPIEGAPEIPSYNFLLIKLTPSYGATVGNFTATLLADCTYEVKYPIIYVRRYDSNSTLRSLEVDYISLISGLTTALTGLIVTVIGIFALLLSVLVRIRALKQRS